MEFRDTIPVIADSQNCMDEVKPEIQGSDTATQEPINDIGVTESQRKTASQRRSRSQGKSQVEAPDDSKMIRCFCGCNQNDLDMIECDVCHSWQHTVCAGFYSNRDRRVKDMYYVCFGCRYKDNKVTMKFLKDLAGYRRALSVAFNEGIESTKWLVGRLGYSVAITNKYIKRMIEDGFIFKSKTGRDKTGKPAEYEGVRTSDVRKRLLKYFENDLSCFPEFTDSQVHSPPPKPNPQTKVSKARKQQTTSQEQKAANEVSQLRASIITDLTLSVTDQMIID